MSLIKILTVVTVSVLFVCKIHLTATHVYTDKDGVTIRYKVTVGSFCGNETERINKFVGIPLAECAKECGIRTYCEGLRYQRRYTLCELVSGPNEGPQNDGGCIFIPASDIVIEQNPCPNCGDGDDTCDIQSRTCKIKECRSEDIDKDAWLTGNMRNVGNKIMQRCDKGYNYSECLNDGTWSKTDDCKPLRNVALHKMASMSSNHFNGYADKGVDGNKFTYFHTSNESNPWWCVDLCSVFNIVEVRVFNRDTYVSKRAIWFSLQLGITRDSLKEYDRVEQLGLSRTFVLPANTLARYVKVQIFTYNFLHLKEVEVMAPTE